jgi:hypothetical protein
MMKLLRSRPGALPDKSVHQDHPGYTIPVEDGQSNKC